ncbi:MAG TPA: radical SAM protein, partial [Flavobacteriales bacterium]|nr:radical SAM protein [Flavobacteriales bacterium]
MRLPIFGEVIFYSDTARLFKTFSFRKAWNLLRLYRSFRASRRSKSAVHKGMPVAISIEPTTACNLGCPECPSGLKVFSRPTGNLRLDLNKRILDELAPWLWYVNFYFQGEPY